MKHEFVLDENILYLGIRGTDEKGKPDKTTTKLLILILKNCHKVVVDKELNRRYAKHIKKLEKISKKNPLFQEWIPLSAICCITKIRSFGIFFL